VRSRWLTALLVLSLAGNATELALYARKAWQAARQRRENARASERRMVLTSNRPLSGAYQAEQVALKRAYIAARAALVRGLHSRTGDSVAQVAAIDKLARIDLETSRLLLHSAQDMQHESIPEIRQRLERRWRLMMGLPLTPGDGR
jgi:hypothetical protein